MSANHEDGGKLKLEHLLQCEVEQQQMQTNLRRASLHSLANNGLFAHSVLPSNAVLKVFLELLSMPSFAREVWHFVFLRPRGNKRKNEVVVAVRLNDC